MSMPIEMPLDDDDRLADPPLLDSFHFEPGPEGFSVIFVPSDGVSSELKESIFLRADSVEGRLMAPLVQKIQRIIQSPVERIIHSGGGNYTFLLPNSVTRQLDDGVLSQHAVLQLFDVLKHMAQIAECAFAFANTSPGRVA